MNFSRIFKNTNMNSISKFSLAFVLFTINIMVAQQDPNFTLYNYNMNIINPAYAGANNLTELSLSHRSQWVGVDNAPETQSLSFSMPLKNNLGIGASIIKDKVFVLKETDIAIDISYKLKLSETHNLFFGVKAGGGFVNINLSDTGAPGNDPLFAENQSFFNTHVGAGLYLKHKNYYVTLSTPNILSGKRYEKDGNVPSEAVNSMHMYLGSGYTFAINPNFQVTPAIMIRHVKGTPVSYDLSSTLKMYDKISLGGNYRIDEMVSIYTLLHLANDKLKLGFAYDITATKIDAVGDENSIEFIIKYAL